MVSRNIGSLDGHRLSAKYNALIVEYRERAAVVGEGLTQRVEAMRRDADLSEVGRLRKITDEWSRAAGESARLWEADQRAVADWTGELEAVVLGNPATFDHAELSSRREAARFARDLDSDEALEAYKDAVLQSDTTLMKAIGAAAIKNRWLDVIDAFGASFDGMSENIDTLVQLYEAAENPFMRSAYYLLMRPIEVDSRAQAA